MGGEVRPRYPVYVPSKGRFQMERALTARTLTESGVPFQLVVEPQEVGAYWQLLVDLGHEHPEERLLTLPFRDLGTSTPARNWIRDESTTQGHDRHWQLDDNIIEFRRLWRGRRIPCDVGAALRVCEDLTDRFDNVAVSGLNYQMFVPAETPVPFYVNVHVYSCTLSDNRAPFHWRLRYNEDTDLCLQALTEGYCTIALNAFMANKLRTMASGGGNTESLYKQGVQAVDTDTEGRFQMAEILRDQWPGLVTIRRRFERFQHVVNWGRFTQLLRLADGVDLAAFPRVDEYGLRLRAVKEVQSPALRMLLEDLPGERIASESQREAIVSAKDLELSSAALSPGEDHPTTKGET